MDPEIQVRVLDMTIYFLLSLQNAYGSVRDFLCDSSINDLTGLVYCLQFAHI